MHDNNFFNNHYSSDLGQHWQCWNGEFDVLPPKHTEVCLGGCIITGEDSGGSYKILDRHRGIQVPTEWTRPWTVAVTIHGSEP